MTVTMMTAQMMLTTVSHLTAPRNQQVKYRYIASTEIAFENPLRDEAQDLYLINRELQLRPESCSESENNF